MRTRKKVRESDRAEIRQLLAHGRTYKEVARITGFSISTVNRCKHGIVQLPDGSEVKTMSPPKPRKPENKLLCPLPDKPIQKKLTARSHFVDGVLVPEGMSKETTEKLSGIDEVFDFLLNLDDKEYKTFIRNVGKARWANRNYKIKLEKLEALKNSALSVKNPAN